MAVNFGISDHARSSEIPIVTSVPVFRGRVCPQVIRHSDCLIHLLHLTTKVPLYF